MSRLLISRLPPRLNREEIISDITVWLKLHNCSLVMPDQVYQHGRHVGTLNVLDGELVFIPSITWEEWNRVAKKYPNTLHDIEV